MKTSAPRFTVDVIEQALEQGLAVITLMQLRDALQSGDVAILGQPGCVGRLKQQIGTLQHLRDEAVFQMKELLVRAEHAEAERGCPPAADRGIESTAMTAPPFTVAEIEQALTRDKLGAFRGGQHAQELLEHLRDALQSGEVAILTKEAREQAITAAFMSGTNQMSAAIHKTDDLFEASDVCEQTARTLLHLPVDVKEA